MAVGDGALVGTLSYLAVGREITYGTYTTCTAGLNFLSAAWNSNKEVMILEEVVTSRTLPNHIYTSKVVEGEVEHYMSARNPANVYILQNAFGGGPAVSATATGDTAGAATFTHEISVNNFATTYSSLCINMRKGQGTTGKIFEYSGIRINEYSISAEIDDAVKCSWSGIAKDATITSNDVSASLTTSGQSQVPLSFVDGRVSIETSAAAITTTSFWHVQSVTFSLNNNLMSDAGSRRIGSDVLTVLPAGVANFEFTATIRFDTTTAYDAMIANTRLWGQLMFQGPTMSGSTLRESIKLDFQNLRITSAGDPEIGGPNEILTSEVGFAVLRDGSTTTGFAVKATVTNDTASYV